MFERIFLLSSLSLVLLLAACGDAREPIPGSSGTPTPTGADTLQASTATPTSDVPPAKLTAVAANTIPPTAPVTTTCPLPTADQCDFARTIDAALTRGDYSPVMDRLVLTPMTCPTFEDFLHNACAGKPGQQVDAFSLAAKLGMFLSLDEARALLQGYFDANLPERPRVVAAGCPASGSCDSEFALVVVSRKSTEHPQIVALSFGEREGEWRINAASYLINGDREPVLTNGVQPLASNGKDVDFAFTRWQP